MEKIGDREKILKEVTKYKKIAVVGLAKNVGKTTTVNFLIEHLSNVCVMTIGRDGEDEDVLYGTAKPHVNLKKDNFAIVPFSDIPKGLEIIETFDVPSGNAAFVKAKIDTAVQTIRIGGFELTNILSDRLLEFCDRVIIDGAFGRTGIASYADAVIIVTGTIAGNISKSVEKIKKMLSCAVDDKIAKELAENHDSIVVANEGRKFIFNPEKEFEKAITLSQKADFIYIPRVIDESVLSRVKCKLVVPSADFVLSNSAKFQVLKKINVIGIEINPSSAKIEIEPYIFIDELKSIFNDIIVFDVLYDS